MMARYGRDFMSRVRGSWDRVADQGRDRGRGPGYARDDRPMQATGPGGEGYFLSRDMALAADETMDYADRGWDDVGDRGFPPGGMAQFGRAGRGYGGDFQAGRGGYDAGELFVNRQGGGTGYRGGYERDPGMQNGRRMAAGSRGYGADYTRSGFAMGYDRGYRGGHLDRGARYGGDYRDMGEGMRGFYGGTNREGGHNRPPFPGAWR
jgi:hypothetical protein